MHDISLARSPVSLVMETNISHVSGPHVEEMSTETSTNEKLFKELDAYDWDKDGEFQAGLSAILGPNPSPSQMKDLTIRARTFYYARKTNHKIDFDAYKAHLASKFPEELVPSQQNEPGEQSSSTPVSQDADANPSYPTSFADIVALINSGAPIPGIMDIPPTVLADKATQPAASKRKKPWETQGELTIADGEGTFGNDRDRIIPQEKVSP